MRRETLLEEILAMVSGLTLISRVNFPILTLWMSPLPFFGASGMFFFSFFDEILWANRIALDGTPRFAASHLGLFCLPLSHKKDAGLIWVKFHEERSASWSILRKTMFKLFWLYCIWENDFQPKYFVADRTIKMQFSKMQMKFYSTTIQHHAQCNNPLYPKFTINKFCV